MVLLKSNFHLNFFFFLFNFNLFSVLKKILKSPMHGVSQVEVFHPKISNLIKHSNYKIVFKANVQFVHSLGNCGSCFLSLHHIRICIFFINET